MPRLVLIQSVSHSLKSGVVAIRTFTRAQRLIGLYAIVSFLDYIHSRLVIALAVRVGRRRKETKEVERLVLSNSFLIAKG